MGQSLRFVLRGEGTTIDAAFEAPGLLFLAAGREGLRLSPRPERGALLCALFMRCGRRVYGASLHEATTVGAGEGISVLKVGDAIRVGTVRLSVARGGKGDSSLFTRRRAIIAAAIAALAAALVVSLFFLQRRPGDESKREALNMSETLAVRAIERSSAPSQADALIEEARRHMREGRTPQAQASLMEAKEMAPEDGRIPGLLEELRRADGDRGQAATEGDEAQAFFEEGLSLMRGGGFSAGCRALGQARELVQKMAAVPPFAAALDQSHGECTEELDRQLASRLAGHAAMLADIDREEAWRAMERLLAARRDVEAVSQEAPAGGEAQRLEEELRRTIAATARRWIAGALAAEQFSGCAGALAVYEQIAAAADAVGSDIAAQAAEGAERCRSRAEKGRER